MPKQDAIPFYDLYGESFLRLEPGFVHLENIASRSKDLGWEIKPHRHSKLAQIICVFDNTWTVEMDDTSHRLSGNWLVVIPPGIVHGFHFAPDTRGWVLSINSDVFNEQELAQDIGEGSEHIWSPHTIEFRDHKQIQRFETLLAMLKEELQFNEAGVKLTVGLLLKLIFVTIARQQHLDRIHSEAGSRETRILLKFRELIEQHYQQHLSVQDYADQLYISVSTLTRICQQHLQESPKKVIRQRLLSEAKRRLIYTKQSIDDIALTLGYKDVGYFCRQFKNQEGLTAGAFRKQSQI